jgi:hypothetical protein
MPAPSASLREEDSTRVSITTPMGTPTTAPSRNGVRRTPSMDWRIGQTKVM